MSESFADVIQANVLNKVTSQIEHVEKAIASQKVAQLDAVCWTDFIFSQIKLSQTGVKLDGGNQNCQTTAKKTGIF